MSKTKAKIYKIETQDGNQDAVQRELELRDSTVIANTVRKSMLNDFK